MGRCLPVHSVLAQFLTPFSPEQAKQAAVTQEQADMSKDAADPAMPCGNPIEPIDGLRKVAGPIPKAAFLLCLVECAERASYYGVRTVFSNFIQFPLPAGK